MAKEYEVHSHDMGGFGYYAVVSPEGRAVWGATAGEGRRLAYAVNMVLNYCEDPLKIRAKLGDDHPQNVWMRDHAVRAAWLLLDSSRFIPEFVREYCFLLAQTGKQLGLDSET